MGVFIGILRLLTVILGYLQAKVKSFPQNYPHFPQFRRWMDKSGEKWWKMEGEQWNGDMSWGIQKLGYRIEIRINFND